MHQFRIGQYGRFDYGKFQRDYRPGFHGIEACLLESEEDIAALIREAENHRFHVGVHFPLRAGQSRLRDALFMALHEDVRAEAFTYAAKEIEAAARVRPVYILFHYPKPVILDDRVDWGRWQFAHSDEYAYESEYALTDFVEQSEQLFQWLTEMGRTYKFTPILEFDALNRYVYELDEVPKLLQRYRDIRLCLDTGRLYFQEKVDPYFDARKVLHSYAPYADLVHLSTLQVEGLDVRNRHFPALPSLKTEEGWAPIEDYIRIIVKANPRVNIMFEHRSDRISDEELDACYRWIHSLVSNPASNDR